MLTLPPHQVLTEIRQELELATTKCGSLRQQLDIAKDKVKKSSSSEFLEDQDKTEDEQDFVDRSNIFETKSNKSLSSSDFSEDGVNEPKDIIDMFFKQLEKMDNDNDGRSNSFCSTGGKELDKFTGYSNENDEIDEMFSSITSAINAEPEQPLINRIFREHNSNNIKEELNQNVENENNSLQHSNTIDENFKNVKGKKKKVKKQKHLKSAETGILKKSPYETLLTKQNKQKNPVIIKTANKLLQKSTKQSIQKKSKTTSSCNELLYYGNEQVVRKSIQYGRKILEKPIDKKKLFKTNIKKNFSKKESNMIENCKFYKPPPPNISEGLKKSKSTISAQIMREKKKQSFLSESLKKTENARNMKAKDLINEKSSKPFISKENQPPLAKNNTFVKPMTKEPITNNQLINMPNKQKIAEKNVVDSTRQDTVYSEEKGLTFKEDKKVVEVNEPKTDSKPPIIPAQNYVRRAKEKLMLNRSNEKSKILVKPVSSPKSSQIKESTKQENLKSMHNLEKPQVNEIKHRNLEHYKSQVDKIQETPKSGITKRGNLIEAEIIKSKAQASKQEGSLIGNLENIGKARKLQSRSSMYDDSNTRLNINKRSTDEMDLHPRTALSGIRKYETNDVKLLPLKKEVLSEENLSILSKPKHIRDIQVPVRFNSIPFIVGQSINKSYHIGLNIQQTLSLFKSTPSVTALKGDTQLDKILSDKGSAYTLLSTSNTLIKRVNCPACDMNTYDYEEERKMRDDEDPWAIPQCDQWGSKKSERCLPKCNCLPKRLITFNDVLTQLFHSEQNKSNSKYHDFLLQSFSVQNEDENEKLKEFVENNQKSLGQIRPNNTFYFTKLLRSIQQLQDMFVK